MLSALEATEYTVCPSQMSEVSWTAMLTSSISSHIGLKAARVASTARW